MRVFADQPIPVVLRRHRTPEQAATLKAGNLPEWLPEQPKILLSPPSARQYLKMHEELEAADKFLDEKDVSSFVHAVAAVVDSLTCDKAGSVLDRCQFDDIGELRVIVPMFLRLSGDEKKDSGSQPSSAPGSAA